MTSLEFQDAKKYLQKIVDDGKELIQKAEDNRKLRKLEVDVEEMRSSAAILEDETFIPMRVVDNNIQREQPTFVAYLKQSRRLAIFKDIDEPARDTQIIESEFTRGMTYPDWDFPLFQALDGAETHGWDTVEVVFDKSKPLHVGIEQVGYDKLFFSKTAIGVQFCPTLIREHNPTLEQLRKFVDEFDFSEAQVSIIREARKGINESENTVRIFKAFLRRNGIVKVAWFSLDNNVSDWLLAPKNMDLGVRIPTPGPVGMDGKPTITWEPMLHREFPLFMLPYRISENKKIFDMVGRVFLDEFLQEAMTAVASGFVNGITRASNIYGSVGQDSGDGGSVKVIEDLTFESGKLFSKPINFWAPNYPDPSVLKTLQYFDIKNQQDTGNVNFAVSNRQDSRKTAKEIEAAQNQASMLSTIQLSLFSSWVRKIYVYVWMIVRSRALQDKFKFVYDSEHKINRYDIIDRDYDVRPAGDVDVIQRMEKLQKMQSSWPVIQTTALKDVFLMDMITLMFPEDAERYNAVLKTQNQLDILKQSLFQVFQLLQGALSRQEFQSLSPQEQDRVKQIMGNAQQLINEFSTSIPGGQQGPAGNQSS